MNLLSIETRGVAKVIFAIFSYILISISSAQLPFSFNYIDHTTDVSPTDIAIGPDGNIFVASAGNGLSATPFDGNSFGSTVTLDDGPTVISVTLGSDGTIFSSNHQHGLRALSFDGSTFTILDNITQNIAAEMDFAMDAVEDSSGNIFLANYGDGLRAYTFGGSILTNTAHIKDGLYATSIAVGHDSIIFVGLGVQGLWAYTYDDTSFSNITNIDEARGYASSIAIGADGSIFVANSEDGLRAYSFDGVSFTNTAHIDDGGKALDVAIGSDGNIYLANGSDGLRAYTYDGSSLTNVAHFITLTNCEGIAVGKNDVIFADNAVRGMAAYSYAISTSVNNDIQNPLLNNWFSWDFPSQIKNNIPLKYKLTRAGRIRVMVYDTKGHAVDILANGNQQPGSYNVMLQTESLSNGVYILMAEFGYMELSQTIIVDK